MTERTPAPQRPYDAETLRARLREFMKFPNQTLITVGMKGAITGYLNSICGSDGKVPDFKRYMMLGWLFGEEPIKPMKSSQLQNAHWFALDSWIQLKPVQSEDGRSLWLPCTHAMTEVLFVLNATLREIDKQRQQEQSMLDELGETQL